MARQRSSVLPPLSRAKAVEVFRIYSVAGLLAPDRPLVTRRPFRVPGRGQRVRYHAR
ncbi:MAG TPA: ATP-binding protein [Chloroflexota bacterium]